MPGQRADRRDVSGQPPPQPMDLKIDQKAIDDSWFTTTTAFVALVVRYLADFPEYFFDSIEGRGLL